MCTAPRAGPRLFYSQPRQLPCVRNPELDQRFSTASQGSCHVHGTPCSCHVHNTSQPRQLPCVRHPVLDQGFSKARQGSCHVHGHPVLDQGFSTASEGSCHVHGMTYSCHVHGTPCWTKAFLQSAKAAAMCTAPRAGPRLFYSQQRQLPCARHPVLDQSFSTASQGSCHVYGTPCWTKAFLQPGKATAKCMAPCAGPRIRYS